MNLNHYFEKHKNQIIILSFLSVVFVIIAGLFLFPSIFYDQWIWKYYWGPIVADADPGSSFAIHNGVQAMEGYTIVSEITYGLVLVLSIYFIYKLLKKLEIVIDWRFCLALMPYIFLGPVSRVLEDADYFNIPAVYWFISPLIYVQIAFFALSFVLLGHFISNNKNKLNLTIALFFLWSIIVSLIWSFGAKYELYLFEPVIFYLISLSSLIPIFISKKEVTINMIVFAGGFSFLLPSIYLVSRWILGLQWSYAKYIRFDVFLVVVGLVFTIVFIVYLISKYKKDIEKFAIYKRPLNLAMLSGHMIDGIVSYISIYDPFNMGALNYVEKHPASNFLMEVWPPLFPIVKFLLIITVIYVFDVLYKDELKNYKSLVNLLKIGILILGFSPGLRDLLRVTMGV